MRTRKSSSGDFEALVGIALAHARLRNLQRSATQNCARLRASERRRQRSQEPVDSQNQQCLRSTRSSCCPLTNACALAQDSLCKVDKNGKVSLRIRIEEVSKNHQKQAFCVKLRPDPDFPANMDVSTEVSQARACATNLDRALNMRARRLSPSCLSATSGGRAASATHWRRRPLLQRKKVSSQQLSVF